MNYGYGFPFFPHQPFVSIVSHYSNQKCCSNYMDSIFVISAVAFDYEVIEKVELYFDDVLVHTDYLKPYGMEFNLDNSGYGIHSIKAMSYSITGNINEQTINIDIDDMPFIEIQSNEYFNENITVSVNTHSCFDITNIEYFFNDSLVEESDGILDISTQQMQNGEQFYIYAKLYNEVGNIVISNTVTVIKMSDESCSSCNANFQVCTDNCQGYYEMCHDMCYGDRGRGGDECYEDCLSTYYYGCNESCSLVFDYCGDCCSPLCWSIWSYCEPMYFMPFPLFCYRETATIDELNSCINSYYCLDCATTGECGMGLEDCLYGCNL
tara:strand:- start:226 stop:1194 length:969 start_codon:yes stop_codon:yes gene_type:complete